MTFCALSSAKGMDIKMSYVTDEKKKRELLDYYYRVMEDWFVIRLEHYSKNEGYGDGGYMWCCFANDYEEWEEDYFGDSGVAYYFDPPAVEEEYTVILTNEEFYAYLVEKSELYLQKYGHRKELVEGYLKTIKENLKL